MSRNLILKVFSFYNGKINNLGTRNKVPGPAAFCLFIRCDCQLRPYIVRFTDLPATGCSKGLHLYYAIVSYKTRHHYLPFYRVYFCAALFDPAEKNVPR